MQAHSGILEEVRQQLLAALELPFGLAALCHVPKDHDGARRLRRDGCGSARRCPRSQFRCHLALAARCDWQARRLRRDSSTFAIGFSTGSRVSSLKISNTRSSGCPRASWLDHPVIDSAIGFKKVTWPLHIGRDHRIADAGEGDLKPFPLLLEFFGPALKRCPWLRAARRSARWRATWILSIFFRAAVRSCCSSSSCSPRASRDPLPPAPYPSTRARILANAVSRSVEVSSQKGAKPQSSVVPSWSRGMNARLRGRDHAPPRRSRCVDRSERSPRQIRADGASGSRRSASERASRSAFARQRHVEVADVELKEARQELRIIHVRAVSGVPVPARAGVHTQRCRSASESRPRAKLFRSMKLDSSSPDGSILSAKRPSVKSICTEAAPFARQRRISVTCSVSKSSMKASRGYPGIGCSGYIRLRADGEMTACLRGTWHASSASSR